MRKLIFIAMVIIFLGYLGFKGRGLLLSPPLTLFSPPDNLVTNERNVDLSGQTTPGVRITANGTQILTNEKGYFKERLVLQQGLNILEIKAFKRYARPRVIERKILVSDEAVLSQKNL